MTAFGLSPTDIAGQRRSPMLHTYVADRPAVKPPPPPALSKPSSTAGVQRVERASTSLALRRLPRMSAAAALFQTYTQAVPNAVPLEIWEGTVLEVDHAAGVMQANLDAQMSDLPRHTGEIDLQWVTDQDKDLVKPGAVFYLTLFKMTEKGTIQNSQELRFRRRPGWSKRQLEQIEATAKEINKKFRARPLAK